MNDPTRPSGKVPGGAVVLGSEAPAAVAPQLQSVMISPTERSAIINGQLVKLGAAFGEMRLVKISENEVVLHSADGNQTLRMYSEVAIKRVEPVPPAGQAPVTITKPVRKKAGRAANGQGTPK